MRKKRIVLLVGGGTAVYILTRAETFDKLADLCLIIAEKTNNLSVSLSLMKTCVDIVQEHPELWEDPRLVALDDQLKFFEIRKNYDKE